MTDIRTGEATALRLQRTYAAPPEAVFDAWTDPEVLRRWWAAGPGWTTPEAQVDLRPGGRYRLSMGNPETGDVHTVFGEYTEVERPRRLAYTWQWEGDSADSPSAGSLVEVEFVAEGDGTTVLLAHTGIRTEDSRARHEHGWIACLDNLAGRVFEA
jgi:uncharacterized protein YndB with AHSA1/START domain